MTERTPGPGEEVDLATIARDDHLLDVLGRGGPAPEGDDLAAMFAAWRDDLDEAVDDPPARPDRAERTSRTGRVGPGMLRLAAAVVAVAALATGLGIVSRDAGPASPLWALTKVLHPEQAEVRLVEDAIREARGAAAAGRLDEAWDLTEQAQRQLSSVEDPGNVRRLNVDLDALRRDLTAAAPASAPPAVAPTPPPSVAPSRPSVAPSPPSSAGPVDPTRAPSERTPTAIPTTRSPLDLPLPDLPGPSLSPRASVLPGLPLPTILPLDSGTLTS